MANPEHLAILKKGVEQWNTWRKSHGQGQPDLSRADLSGPGLRGVNPVVPDRSGASLSGAYLCRADFRGVQLNQADLDGANLHEADLVRADLSGANLRKARLIEADFGRADLSDVNLRGARLWSASFRQANLRRTDFTQAKAGECQFANLDLSEAKGLEAVLHNGPSTVGIDTIYKSKGKIPEVFLRGCGVPEEFIAYIASMVGHPIEYYSCFLSYSTKDQEFADRLYADLQAKGVRCWFAPHDIRGGRKIHEQIGQAIRVHDQLLLILSAHSMASDWVGTEIANAREREAREKKQMLFPITIAPFEEVKQWKLFDADRGPIVCLLVICSAMSLALPARAAIIYNNGPINGTRFVWTPCRFRVGRRFLLARRGSTSTTVPT